MNIAGRDISHGEMDYGTEYSVSWINFIFLGLRSGK